MYIWYVCKSHVNVNHLCLHVWTFYIYTYIVAMYICVHSHLHETNVNMCQINLHGPMKCIGVCKCIYYIPLMTIPSCKSILINCECIPKFFFFFVVVGHFDWPFTKKSWYFDTLQTLTFYQYGTIVVLFQGISWMHILSHLIAWVKLLFLIFFIAIFGLNFHKSLGTYCDPY